MADRRSVQQNLERESPHSPRKPVFDDPQGKVIEDKEKQDQFDEIMHKEVATGDERTEEEKAQAEQTQQEVEKQDQSMRTASQQEPEQDKAQTDSMRDAFNKIRLTAMEMENSEELADVLSHVTQAELAVERLDIALKEKAADHAST